MPKQQDNESSFERMQRRRAPRRVLRSLADLRPAPEAAAAFEQRTGEPAPEYLERGLQEFFDRGIITTIIRQLKSGKEATVYVARGPEQSGTTVAVKVYHEIDMRSFRNDAQYSAGRFIGDARLTRAVAQGSTRGLRARQALWVEHEYDELRILHDAGVNVPRPLAHAGRAIAMEFAGEGDEPAPRISEARLTPAEARDAFEQAVGNLAAIVACGRVHGDYSAFNLLWWRGAIVVIDLPQLVRVDENPNAAELLRRDIESLCSTFSRFDIPIDRTAVTRRVVALDGSALRSSPLRRLISR